MTKLVIIPLLPFDSRLPIGKFFGKIRTRDWTRHWENTLPFAKAGVASWKKWTSLNNVKLEVAEELPSPDECGYSIEQIELLASFPPTVLRWLLPLAAHRKYGDKIQIALIDADTLILPNAPSIFEQNLILQTDVILTRDRPGWNEWRNSSYEAFALLFPDVLFNKNLYFNAGVMVLNNTVLPTAFLNFVLKHSTELMKKMTGTTGTDQTPLNFVLQQLLRDNKTTVSFLDSRWNGRMDVILENENSNKSSWPALARKAVLDNHISHFIRTKDLMPSVWQFLEDKFNEMQPILH